MFPWRTYRREWLRGDIVAGITVASICIPESLGYADIVGLPLQTGLYTALVPAIVFAVLASSRQLVVGADSATAALVAAGAGAVVAATAPGYSGAVAVLSVMTGALLVLMAVLRLGFLADLISAPVLSGFLSGVGVSLVIGKLPGMLGIDATGSTWDKLVAPWRNIDAISWTSAALSAGVVAIMLIGERVHWRLPAALAGLVTMSVVAAGIDAADRGVAMVGAIPPGLPSVELPSIGPGELATMLPFAAAIAVVVLAQSAAVARSFGAKNNYRIDENADLLALGAANAVSGVTGGFAVNGSPPRTSAGDKAGGRSQVVNLVMALVVGLILLFATGLFAYIPAPVLDAVVFAIGIGLIQVAQLRSIASCRRAEFATAMVALAVVAFVGVKEGVLLAVLISLADRLRRQYRPADVVLAEPGHVDPRLARRIGPRRPIPEDVVVFRYGTSLFFENASYFTDRIHSVLRSAQGPVHLLVLDLAAMSDLDYTGVQTLQRMARDLDPRGVHVVITELAPSVSWLVVTSGLEDLVQVVPRLEDAVFAPRGQRAG